MSLEDVQSALKVSASVPLETAGVAISPLIPTTKSVPPVTIKRLVTPPILRPATPPISGTVALPRSVTPPATPVIRSTPSSAPLGVLELMGEAASMNELISKHSASSRLTEAGVFTDQFILGSDGKPMYAVGRTAAGQSVVVDLTDAGDGDLYVVPEASDLRANQQPELLTTYGSRAVEGLKIVGPSVRGTVLRTPEGLVVARHSDQLEPETTSYMLDQIMGAEPEEAGEPEPEEVEALSYAPLISLRELSKEPTSTLKSAERAGTRLLASQHQRTMEELSTLQGTSRNFDQKLEDAVKMSKQYETKLTSTINALEGMLDQYEQEPELVGVDKTPSTVEEQDVIDRNVSRLRDTVEACRIKKLEYAELLMLIGRFAMLADILDSAVKELEVTNRVLAEKLAVADQVPVSD